MEDPCNPTPHHAWHPVHHLPSDQTVPHHAAHAIPHHAPGQVVGRITRHGTHRLARRLHALAGACPAGPPLTIGLATLKTVAPAAAFAGLTTLASGLARRASVPSMQASPPDEAGSRLVSDVPHAARIDQGGQSGALGVAPPAHGNQHHAPVSVPEPPSLTLMLLVTIGWIGLRFSLRRARPAS